MNAFLMKFRILIAAALILTICLGAYVPSKYVSRTGHIHVESSNRFKNIVADNYQVYCELIPGTGQVQFTGLMKSFEFQWGALDQAFNSKRLDLSQFSKFTFDGSLTNAMSIPWDKPGTYPAQVQGTLMLGGYTRITSATGNVVVLPDGKIKANANFTIKIEEESVNTINTMMKQKLPSVFALDVDKLGISRDIKLNLTANYRPRG